MRYQHGLPGWDEGKVAELLGALYNGDHDMNMVQEISELYIALLWIYDEYRTLRSMVAEMRMAAESEVISTIDAGPHE